MPSRLKSDACPVFSNRYLMFSFIVYSILVSAPLANGKSGNNTLEDDAGKNVHSDNINKSEHESPGVHVVSIHYKEVRDPLIFTVVVLITAVCKVVYHHVHFLSSKVPESCILVLLGVLFGAVIEFSGADHDLPTFFSPHQFFLFLLPPITLEAAYSLHDRTLLENIGSILLFAIVGTVAACLIIGLSMYGLSHTGAMGDIVNMGLMEYLVFAALIVAVDPVAVLAVFSEIGVNNVLYFIVFGESLLNDGVTVVLYSVFQELKQMNEIGTTDVLLGLLRFFVVCVGGFIVGILAGLLTALITKYTTHVKGKTYGFILSILAGLLTALITKYTTHVKGKTYGFIVGILAGPLTALITNYTTHVKALITKYTTHVKAKTYGFILSILADVLTALITKCTTHVKGKTYGFIMGILADLLTALITKYTTHVKVIEPIVIFAVAYLGYLISDLFTFSGIISMIGCGLTQKQYAFHNISDRARSSVNYFSKVISMIGCGLTQKQYAFHNISDRARSSVNYFSKVISNINEIIIFLFLGIAIVSSSLQWHTGFTLWAMALCLVYRFIITYALAFLINRNGGLRKITFPEQFMIAYGGLRGAVCFSLVALLDEKKFPQKNMFVTSSFAVILFTVFVQGISIKPLVYRLRISLTEDKDETMFEELNDHVTDQVMTALEQIIGDHGHNHLRERLRDFDAKYLKPLLLVKTKRKNALLHMFYENLLLREHYKHLQLSGAKTEKPKELSHIDTCLLLNTLANEDGEDDQLSETESTPSTDQDTGYTNSPGSSDTIMPLPHGRDLFLPASTHDRRRSSLFGGSAQDSNHRFWHNNHNHHHHNHKHQPHHHKGSLACKDCHQTRGHSQDEGQGDQVIPAITVTPASIVDNENDPSPARDWTRRKSMSDSTAFGEVRTQDLRDMINKNQKSNMDAWRVRYDPDMHHHGNLPSEIKNKTNSNRKLSLMPGHHVETGESTEGRALRRRWTLAPNNATIPESTPGDNISRSNTNVSSSINYRDSSPVQLDISRYRRHSTTGSPGTEDSGGIITFRATSPVSVTENRATSPVSHLVSLAEECEEGGCSSASLSDDESKAQHESKGTKKYNTNKSEDRHRLTSASDSNRNRLTGEDNLALDMTLDSGDNIELHADDALTFDAKPTPGMEVNPKPDDLAIEITSL
ncbi:monocarboxylate transporter [Plakobranchus ocellatus]|uniref:Monocarboxylate transporter n=1 Tax=Plakobranchus ocellatus TaxID=259542 RepID=A0AAV3XUH4_9GAST|nr:monocarboxylate transporter [Plakobranchus ocellatus]